MLKEIRLPEEIPRSDERPFIGRWFKKIGDAVTAGEPIVEVLSGECKTEVAALGRRKPVFADGIVLMLLSGIDVVYFPEDLPPYVGGLVFGIGSGAAMIPYTMIKEASPDNVKGSATGAMNFLIFSFSAFLAPAFGLVLLRLSDANPLTLQTFHEADLIWVGAIVLSLILTFFLRETGVAARSAPLAAPARSS